MELDAADAIKQLRSELEAVTQRLVRLEARLDAAALLQGGLSYQRPSDALPGSHIKKTTGTEGSSYSDSFSSDIEPLKPPVADMDAPNLESGIMPESAGSSLPEPSDYALRVMNSFRRSGDANVPRLLGDNPLYVEPDTDDKFGILLHQTLQDEVLRARFPRVELAVPAPETTVGDAAPTAGELLRQLATLTATYEEMRKQIDDVAEQARAAGATWKAIADAAEMTPQAAHKRWSGKAQGGDA